MIDACSARLTTNSERGIFHGIDDSDHHKTRVITGFSGLVDNRVGVGSRVRKILDHLKDKAETNETSRLPESRAPLADLFG